MQFLTNQYCFKNAAKKIQQTLAVKHQDYQSLFKAFSVVLGDQINNHDDRKRLYQATIKIDRALYRLGSPDISWTRLLDIISNAFTGLPYQKYIASIPKQEYSFKKIFNLRENFTSNAEGVVEHPFPAKFEEIDELKEWQGIWEASNYSLDTNPFIPPMIPPSYFGVDKVTVKKRSSWNERSIEGLYITAGCSFYANQRLVGIQTWYLWGRGHLISGIEVAFTNLKRDQHYFFDLRPRYSLPTLGPKKIDRSPFRTMTSRYESLPYHHKGGCYS